MIIRESPGQFCYDAPFTIWIPCMTTLPPDEVFPNPTVLQVVFQIRFPSLFFIEGRLGDIQLAIMSQFPESEVRLHRAVLLAQGMDPEAMVKQLPPPESTMKIWTFKNRLGVVVELKQDSLTILSTQHKSYKTGPGSFRSVIEFVLASLLKLVPIPVVTRLGLRYIDACPVPNFSTDGIASYYNSTLPLNRFGAESISGEMVMRATVARGQNRRLQYAEQLQPADATTGTPAKLILDFDASAENIIPESILSVADDLHSLIRAEFEATIKQPVIDWMRTPLNTGIQK